MERMVLSGFVHPVLADVVVGALFGAGVLATCAGAFLPLLAYGMAGGWALCSAITIAFVMLVIRQPEGSCMSPWFGQTDSKLLRARIRH